MKVSLKFALSVAWVVVALAVSEIAPVILTALGAGGPDKAPLLAVVAKTSFILLAVAPVVWRWRRLYRELLP